MKRKLLPLMVAIIGVLILFSLKACRCNHDWEDATCIKSQTCTRCGKTKGELISHNWKEATYTTPKTCTVCGVTEGEPKESPYKDCATWNEVFEEIFDDSFTFKEGVSEKKNEKGCFLFFDNIASVDNFIVATTIVALALGDPEGQGINVKDEQELTVIILSLNEGASLTIIKTENTLSGFSTLLSVSEKNEVTNLIQSRYNEFFSHWDLETKLKQ